MWIMTVDQTTEIQIAMAMALAISSKDKQMRIKMAFLITSIWIPTAMVF